jgi:hypothetical protein
MTNLTPRQFIDAVTRSLRETGQQMAAKYKDEAHHPQAPSSEAPKEQETGLERRGQTPSSARREP